MELGTKGWRLKAKLKKVRKERTQLVMAFWYAPGTLVLAAVELEARS
jgi:hypothetical protein